MEKELKKTKKQKTADQISKEIARLSASCEITLKKIEEFLQNEVPTNDQARV